MRISIQACVEGDDSSPRVISIGCVERDAGVDPAFRFGLFREASMSR